MMDRPIPPFYCVYLLRSTQLHASLYVGSTPNPRRRLKQHNGGTEGGAKRTAGKNLRPWEMSVMVAGFPSKIAALQFEWAWQNTHFTRHITEDERITIPIIRTIRGRERRCKPRDTILDKVKNLHLLLRVDSFRQWPLEVRFFSKHVFDIWEKWRAQQVAGIRDGIPIHLDDNTMHATLASNTTGTTEPPTPAGVEALDVTYATLRPSIKKSVELLNETGNLNCFECSGHFDRGNDLILVCPTNGCNMTCHLSCLANSFLANSSETNAVLPTEGSCPVCDTKLKWSDLMRDLSLRARGQAALSLIMKEPKRKKTKASDTATGDQAQARQTIAILSEGSANQRHVRDDDDPTDLFHNGYNSVNDTGEDELEYREEVSEMAASDWDDIDEIDSVEFEAEVEGGLPIILRQSLLEETESSTRKPNLPNVVPDSEFEDIDEILG